MSILRKKQGNENRKLFGLVLFVTGLSVSFSACSEIQKPVPEPFYAETVPPAKQEFRWSNGKVPKSFDPARASAAPETDIVRALFEGLTDIDSRTLKEIPAVSEKWTSSPDFRVWTFQLRKDARWSNGDRVTPDDFVTSWKRLAALGDNAAHPELFQNIVGMRTRQISPLVPGDAIDLVHSPIFSEESQAAEHPASASSAKTPKEIIQTPENSTSNPKPESKLAAKPTPEGFGVEAVDEDTLRVRLEMPDKDFPTLVANPIFRPVYGDAAEFDTTPTDANVVTNGPFSVASVGRDGILLDRSDTYWNRASVKLEHVRFVSKENAEAALSAYKRGEIDVLTNAEFEPLAVKLLSPYDDFRQTTHSGLNFYEFNTKNAPFNDRRVREALAISIDRERIIDGELEGTARPAGSFLPLNDKTKSKITLDIQKAKLLLQDAGFTGGSDFPKIKLLINRNDTQQRVARAVAKMWKQNLNLDTEIVVLELSQIDAARALGKYDLVRRGVVLPTVDEFASMVAVFGTLKNPEVVGEHGADGPELKYARPSAKADGIISTAPVEEEAGAEETGIFTEGAAIRDFNAIPLYFPMAYSLVKPYVKGFEVNGLDAPAIANVSIDDNWQPKVTKGAHFP